MKFEVEIIVKRTDANGSEHGRQVKERYRYGDTPWLALAGEIDAISQLATQVIEEIKFKAAGCGVPTVISNNVDNPQKI